MDKIITGTGKVFYCNYLTSIPEPPLLFIRVENTTLDEVKKVFSDSSETKKITYGASCIENYTSLLTLEAEGDVIRISLAKQ